MMVVLKFLNSLIMFEFHVLLIEEFEIKNQGIFYIPLCVNTGKQCESQINKIGIPNQKPTQHQQNNCKCNRTNQRW